MIATTKNPTLVERIDALNNQLDPESHLGEIQELAWYIKAELLHHLSQEEIDLQLKKIEMAGWPSSTPFWALCNLVRITYSQNHRVLSWYNHHKFY